MQSYLNDESDQFDINKNEISVFPDLKILRELKINYFGHRNRRLEENVNINDLVRDALLQKNVKESSNLYENVLSYPLKEAREKFEKDYLTSQLKKNRGNISKTAEFIGMERSALHRKLKTLGIKGVN